MDANALLNELGSHYGQTFKFSDEGVCSVGFDNEDVDFELVGNDLFFIASVGSSIGHEAGYETLLAACLNPVETGGAYFAIDTNQSEILMLKKLPSEMEYDVFEAEVVAYLKALRNWKEKLPTLGSESQSDTSLNPAMMGLAV